MNRCRLRGVGPTRFVRPSQSLACRLPSLLRGGLRPLKRGHEIGLDSLASVGHVLKARRFAALPALQFAL